MSVNAASASARSASRSTTTRSWPPTRSTRTPSAVSLRYGAVSAPSGNSGVCLYGGGTAAGAFMAIFGSCKIHLPAVLGRFHRHWKSHGSPNPLQSGRPPANDPSPCDHRGRTSDESHHPPRRYRPRQERPRDRVDRRKRQERSPDSAGRRGGRNLDERRLSG